MTAVLESEIYERGRWRQSNRPFNNWSCSQPAVKMKDGQMTDSSALFKWEIYRVQVSVISPLTSEVMYRNVLHFGIAELFCLLAEAYSIPRQNLSYTLKVYGLLPGTSKWGDHIAGKGPTIRVKPAKIGNLTDKIGHLTQNTYDPQQTEKWPASVPKCFVIFFYGPVFNSEIMRQASSNPQPADI